MRVSEEEEEASVVKDASPLRGIEGMKREGD